MLDDPEPASRVARARASARWRSRRGRPATQHALGAVQARPAPRRRAARRRPRVPAVRRAAAARAPADRDPGLRDDVDRSAPKEAGEALGLGPTLLESVGESAKLSTGTRWSVVLFAVVALLWSAISAARAIRAVHSLAWEGRVGRAAPPAARRARAARGDRRLRRRDRRRREGARRAGPGGAADQHRRAGRLRRHLARASRGCCRTATRTGGRSSPGRCSSRSGSS